MGTPAIEESFNVVKATTPMDCRLRDLNYSAPITVDIQYTRGRETIISKNILIGRMPIMLRSSNCVLTNKSHYELAQLKECPHDPGGYFIINGQEKVILIQEQVVRNRILLEEDSKGCTIAICNSATHERKTRTNVIGKGNKYSVRLNIFSEVSFTIEDLGFLSTYSLTLRSNISGCTHCCCI